MSNKQAIKYIAKAERNAAILQKKLTAYLTGKDVAVTYGGKEYPRLMGEAAESYFELALGSLWYLVEKNGLRYNTLDDFYEAIVKYLNFKDNEYNVRIVPANPVQPRHTKQSPTYEQIIKSFISKEDQETFDNSTKRKHVSTTTKDLSNKQSKKIQRRHKQAKGKK